MPTAREVLKNKGSHVFSIGPQATAHEAALLMNEHKIGCLVVLDGGCIVGIFTERDMLRRVVARRLDPADALVGDVMTREVVCCQPDATLDDARSVIMHRRIRHLPVVDDRGRLNGLISIGDLNAWQITGQEIEIQYLHEYIHGRV
ncbi:CBS domain-containing protein [Phycisphaerales bacterium AB-hyl4]|uniref:CBS domain-containing protein n=1 Tax=Natronomicrosphaera hydrolytica TaxID=3242702 RepID=A0ABV4U9V6_9BACT